MGDSDKGGLPDLARTVYELVKKDDADALNALHASGEWTDLGIVADSMKQPDGITWYYTALALAATHNQLGVMRLLIQLGAKTDEEREWHHLPSTEAAGMGSIEGLKLLKENGCNISAQDRGGRSPVLIAAQQGHLPVLQLLHSWGEDMHVADANGNTPLDWAKSEAHTE
jgi:hypothetical protein